MHPAFDLMIISDGGPDLLTRCARALAGAPPGRVAVQLREPMRDAHALHALGQGLRTLTRAHGATLLVNDHIELACAIEADGVHLPERNCNPQAARARLGSTAIVGVSRHDARGLAASADDGVDYATLSPVHAVAGKAPPLGIAGFAALCRAARLPVYALGGVRVADVGALLEAGARGVAVIREVLAAADPGARTRRLIEAFEPH